MAEDTQVIRLYVVASGRAVKAREARLLVAAAAARVAARQHLGAGRVPPNCAVWLVAAGGVQRLVARWGTLVLGRQPGRAEATLGPAVRCLDDLQQGTVLEDVNVELHVGQAYAGARSPKLKRRALVEEKAGVSPALAAQVENPIAVLAQEQSAFGGARRSRSEGGLNARCGDLKVRSRSGAGQSSSSSSSSSRR